MFLGKVTGSVWATQKEEGMDDVKLMVVQPTDFQDRDAGSTVIAADRMGAGVGEKVIVARGSPVRMLFGGNNGPIDAMIVGIVDSYDVTSPAEEESPHGAAKG